MNDTVPSRFVWIDLEMTGLSIEQDHILEIACTVTDPNLNIIDNTPNIAIKYSEEILQRMDSWNTLHHTQSGLLDNVRVSAITTGQAEETILTFIKKHCKQKTAPLCGNSVWVDRMFLQKHMPVLESYLHYRTIDVSTVKLLAQQWYHIDTDTVLQKQSVHRAHTDILESIKELRWYRATIFKQE